MPGKKAQAGSAVESGISDPAADALYSGSREVMNGFAYATNRWSYGMVFLCALMAVRAVCLLKEQRTGIFLLLALAAGIVASLLAGSYRWTVWRSVAVFALTVLAFAGGAVLEKKKKSRLAGMLVSAAVLCGICWNLLSFFTPLGFHYAQRFQTKGRQRRCWKMSR